MARHRKKIPLKRSIDVFFDEGWDVGLLLSANLLWTSLHLGGVRAETMVVSWTLTTVTLAWVLFRMAWTGRRMHWAGWLVLPFLAYAALNVLFVSPVYWLGMRDWLNWAQLAATLWICLNGLRARRVRRFVLGTVVVLGAIAVILAIYQAANPGWLLMNRVQAEQYVGRASGFLGNPNNMGALFALIIPPAMAWMWRPGTGAVSRISLGYLAVCFIAGLIMTVSRGGMLASALALICWPLCVREWRWGRRMAAFATVTVAVALIGVVVGVTVPSVRDRMVDVWRKQGEKSRAILWDASLRMTGESPVCGTGAGSFNTVFEKYRPEGFLDEPQWAHNEYLNTLSDYGIVGFVLLGGAIGVAIWRTRSPRPRGEPTFGIMDEVRAETAFVRAIGIGLMAFALACLVDFHLKIPAVGMIATLFVSEWIRRREVVVLEYRRNQAAARHPAEIEAEIAAELERPKSRRLVFRGVMICSALAAMVLTYSLALPIYRAEASRVVGRELIDTLAHETTHTEDMEKLVVLAEAANALRDATDLDSQNAQAWSDRAYAMSLWAKYSGMSTRQFGNAAEMCARRALSESSIVAEFWVRLGVAQDLQASNTIAGESFAQALVLAPSSPLVWYHQAYHLSLNSVTWPMARSAIEICLRLDPSYSDANILAEKLRIR